MTVNLWGGGAVLSPAAWAKNFFQENANSLLHFSFSHANISKVNRPSKIKHPGVAKFGIALDWGSRGRRFKSCHSDQ